MSSVILNLQAQAVDVFLYYWTFRSLEQLKHVQEASGVLTALCCEGRGGGANKQTNPFEAFLWCELWMHVGQRTLAEAQSSPSG